MTPTELEEYARQNFNAVGDTFYSQSEIFRHIFNAQMELARETNCIRNVYTTSTAIGTQEYDKPTNCLSIKRVSFNGVKLIPIDMREDDALTGNNAATTATGTPVYYFEWDDSIYLRPVPDAVGTLKIFSFDMPQEVSATSTLDVPERYHHDIADYILARMALKDKNTNLHQYYKALWNEAKDKAVRSERKILRGDAFRAVNDETTLYSTWIGST